MRDLAQLLEEARRLTGAASVSLRCELASLETIYLDVDAGHLVAHDRSETSCYLSAPHEGTYQLWEEDRARAVCERYGVLVTRSSGDGDESFARIERGVAEGDDPARVIAAVGDAVEAVFAAHGSWPEARPPGLSDGK
jgi:hypothetical protein